ncbi:CZB domain-containing protein [Adhaeribacter aquaticus]|uniref:CZB domain-containing protein n=1 Tax=Adhaeribacter aquaticus TaxID=299567 RepID=UPI000408C570|nr:CZB domain-containing protein [Adhaeribacter aquaticus]
MENLDQEFKLALTKHLLFKSKVKSFLYGADIALNPILDQRQCNFGIWITQIGLPNYGHITEMVELARTHNKIHEHAIQLVNLKKAGKEEEAISGIPELEKIADKLLDLLKNIQIIAEKNV